MASKRPRPSVPVRRLPAAEPSPAVPLLSQEQLAAQPAPWVHPVDKFFEDVPIAKDHHVRAVEMAAVKMLMSIGWVFTSGVPGRTAPHLIRPRKLDHLGGC